MIMQKLDLTSLFRMGQVCRGFEQLTRNDVVFLRHVQRICAAMPLLRFVINYRQQLLSLLRSPHAASVILCMFEWNPAEYEVRLETSLVTGGPYLRFTFKRQSRIQRVPVYVSISRFYSSLDFSTTTITLRSNMVPMYTNQRRAYAELRYRALILDKHPILPACYIL